jgi:hypothetical protein
LVLDDKASTAADAHCKEMVENAFTSHWGLNGDKPYQRYNKAGVADHVSENIVGADGEEGKPLNPDAGSVEKQMLTSQGNFMEESAPNDLNKQNTLDARHTHIGIGVHCTEQHFRYSEVYIDRYVQLDTPPAELTGTDVTITGKVLDSKYGPYALTVFYDPPSEGMSADTLNSEEYNGGYPDFSDKQVAVTWPWEMTIGEDGAFSIPVSMPEVESGTYYFQLYVKSDKDSIPYAAHQAGVTVPSADTSCATGFVASYSGPTLTPGGDAGGAAAPITELLIVPAIEQVPGGMETAPLVGTAECPLRIAFARGDTGSPITEMHVCTAGDVPDGFDAIEGSLAALADGGAEEGAEEVVLCVRRGQSAEELASPVTDVCLCTGQPADESWSAVQVPVASGSPWFLCFRNADPYGEGGFDDDGELLHGGMYDDDGIDAGDVLLEDEEEDAILEEEAEHEEEMSPEELAEAEARAAEAEERRRVQKCLADEKDARAAQAQHLNQLVAEAHAEREALMQRNQALQKQLAPYLQRKAEGGGGGGGGGGQKDEKTSSVENEKRYYDALASVIEERGKLQRAQAQYDRIAMSLQGRLDEKESKANEISASFRDFKREIGKGAENSRTGKPIPAQIIQQYEATESKKDQDVEKVRLKNINLRTHLRKLEQQLRAKEQLAEGLHLIDFEQLKIENQTLNEKIEERNEELHKLRKKTTTTVQVLTHIKEKLQFVQVRRR